MPIVFQYHKSILCCLILCFSSFTTQLYAQNSVDGIVWLDRNDNGQQEPSDSFLDGIRLELYNSSSQFVAFTFTNSNGYYQFLDVSDGTYFILSDLIDGLQAVVVNSQNSDSSINASLRSQEFILNGNNTSESLDAGYRSSIVLVVPNQLDVCLGDEVSISANVIGNSGQVTYDWNNNESNNSSVNIFTASNSTEITLTVFDIWGIPITRTIKVDVFSELIIKDCLSQDDFNNEVTHLNLDISPSQPGPNIDIDLDFLGLVGGERIIKYTLLEGMAFSSLNISELGLFVSNCVDCKTLTEICYYYPDNQAVNLSEYDYTQLNDIVIDQGDTKVTVIVSDGNTTAKSSNILKAKGLNNKFNYRFEYSDFENIDIIDLDHVVSICFEVETLEGGSDLSLSGTVSCAEIECKITVPKTIDICSGDSAELSAESSCGDEGLLYVWDGVGIGNTQTVSPSSTTIYDLVVYDRIGCSQAHSVIVNVNLNPEIQLEGDLSVCNEEETTYSINHISGLAPYTYQWNIDDSGASELTVIISQSTTIAVTVTDANGCHAEKSVEVTALQNPKLELSAELSDCDLSTGSVSSLVSQGDSPHLYQWSNGESTKNLINVSSGTYGLTVTDNNGCTVESSIFVANNPCAELGNYVWEDLNYNGLQDVGETPIFGMTLYLKDVIGNIISETTTNETGFYLFSDLESGEYQIQFSTFGDFVVTKHQEGGDNEIDSDVDPVTFMSMTVNLSENEKNYTIDGGFYRPGSIGDFVWNDMDSDGVQDNDEPGIEGLAVKLLDCNNTVIDTTYTDEEGLYMFIDLVPGDYSLDFCDTAGFIFTEQFIGLSNSDSDADMSTGMTECKTLMSGDVLKDCDAGLVELATIGDYVWLDTNADGVQASEELGLEGILLRLHSCDGIILATTTTDDTGFYEFENIEPGDYYVSGVYGDEYELSPQNIGLDDELDSDFGSNGQTTCTTLLPGEVDNTFDLGLFEFAALGDYVWWDKNLNGIQDEESSSSLSGYSIKLYDCNGTIIDSTITNDNGIYLFDSLLPGEYQISTDLSESMKFTLSNEGDDLLDSDISAESGFSSCVNLESGEQNTSLDIGIVFLSTIGDYVWLDEDLDGVQDTAESGVMDILISLFLCDGELISTTMTDENGQWIFENVPYGEYEIVVDIPEPLSGTLGFNGNIQEDSNLNPETNIIECFEINMPIDTSFDIGLVDCSIISGIAWLDAVVDNGILDDVENGINGLTVTIFKLEMDTWTLFGTTITKHIGIASGQDGFWEYCVPNGSYYIHFAKLPNFPFVDANQGNNDDVDSEVTHEFGLNTTDLISILPGVPQPNINAGYVFNSTFLEDAVIDNVSNQNLISNNSNAKAIELNVFPNPSLDKVYIEVKHTGDEPQVIQIVNSEGRKIQFTNQSRSVENGVYLLELSVDVPGCHFIDLFIGGKKKTVSFIKI